MTRTASPPGSGHGPTVVVLLLAVVATVASLRVDVPAKHGAIKGDESTYVAMALSVAGDGDLAFERKDLERFRAATQAGPEGIFLKLGRRLDLEVTSRWPFVVNQGRTEPGSTRVYFGKAWVHALVAAPFVRAFGLNGLVLTNALLLVLVVAAGYVFAATRVRRWTALGLSSAFICATVAPVYVLWLTPEVVNLAFVFLAFFLWFYKDVSGTPETSFSRAMHGGWTDWAGVLLVALATFSKPPNLLLVAPVVVARLFQGKPRRAVVLGATFVALVVGAFALNMVITGEANYQGGVRKTFYGRFPFDAADSTFESRGIDMATNEAGVDEMVDRSEFWPRFSNNVVYFFIGRHFGLAPYHWPGLLIALLWLAHPRSWRIWQAATLAAVTATALALLVYTPFSWSGGGGPLGNRYFLSVYPALFFLLPPLTSTWPAVAAWVGGLACTWYALAHPFAVAYRPGLASQRGIPRLLPVELTMVNDLPVMLTDRGRVPYGRPPNDVLLYLLDDNAWLPDPDQGIWVRGGARADIVVRSGERPRRLMVTMRALTETPVRVSAGGSERTLDVRPGEIATLMLSIKRSVFTRQTYSFVLSVAPERGTEPRLVDPGSTDARYLGVSVHLTPVYDPPGSARPAR